MLNKLGFLIGQTHEVRCRQVPVQEVASGPLRKRDCLCWGLLGQEEVSTSVWTSCSKELGAGGLLEEVSLGHFPRA